MYFQGGRVTRSSSNSAVLLKRKKAVFDDSGDNSEDEDLKLKPDSPIFANLVGFVSSDDDDD